MKRIGIIGKGRKEARDIVIKLPRKEEFLVNTLRDGKKIYIRTDGRKTSKVDGKPVKNLDITVHYDDERKGLNYIDDLLIDVILKKQILGKDKILILVEAIKEAIELKSIEKIYEEHPELKKFEEMNLPGHSIDFLLKVIPILALQEDVNYWGWKPSKKEKYEGREKPYNALFDFIVKEHSLFNVIKKHRLVIVFMG